MEGLSPFFRLIHDFLVISLPKEQKCSENTIRSYRKSLEMLLDYVKTEKNIRLDEITFEMIDRQILSGFLDYLEEDRKCSPSTRNQRLHAINSFYRYAAQEDITVVSSSFILFLHLLAVAIIASGNAAAAMSGFTLSTIRLVFWSDVPLAFCSMG